MSIVCEDRSDKERGGRHDDKCLVLDFPGTKTRLEVPKHHWRIMGVTMDANNEVSHFRIEYAWGARSETEKITMVVPADEFWFENHKACFEWMTNQNYGFETFENLTGFKKAMLMVMMNDNWHEIEAERDVRLYSASDSDDMDDPEDNFPNHRKYTFGDKKGWWGDLDKTFESFKKSPYWYKEEEDDEDEDE